MAKWGVSLVNTVSTVVYVEAESREEAIDAALMEGLPGLMFLNHEYPDEGDWDVPSAFDEHSRPEDDAWEVEE